MSLRKRKVVQKDLGDILENFNQDGDDCYTETSKRRKIKKGSKSRPRPRLCSIRESGHKKAAKKSNKNSLVRDDYQLGKLLAWKGDLERIIKTEDNANHSAPCKTYVSDNILNDNLEKYGNNIQGLFINIKWKQAKVENSGVTMMQFEKLKIPKSLIKNGIVFIWSSKDLIYNIISRMKAMNFAYIENICICQLYLPGSEESTIKPVKNNNQADSENSTTVENLTWDEKKFNFMKNLPNYSEKAEDCFMNQDQKFIKTTKKIL